MRPQEMSICRRRRFKKIKVHRPNLEPAATPKLHTHKHNRTRGPTAERAPSTVYRAITGYQVCDWTSIGDNVIHILWPLSLRCFLHFHFGLLRFAKIYFFSVSTIVLCVLATILNHLWRHSFYLYSKHYVTMQRSISYLKFSLNACHSEIYDRVEHIWTWFLWFGWNHSCCCCVQTEWNMKTYQTFNLTFFISMFCSSLSPSNCSYANKRLPLE